MTSVVSYPLLLACLVGAVWSALAAARDRRPSNQLLLVLVAAEALVLVQLVVAVFAVARTSGSDPRLDSAAVFLLYAAFMPLVLPVGVFWSSAEKSRSSTLVLTITCIAVVVMSLRMTMMWGDRAIA